MCADPATDADTYETKLIDGDIVILFVSFSRVYIANRALTLRMSSHQTDGLSDNVFPTELVSICSLVSRQYAHAPPPPPPTNSSSTHQTIQSEEEAQAQTIAERIVNYAQLCMKNKKRVSPFERAAAREGMYFRGGVSTLMPTIHLDG